MVKAFFWVGSSRADIKAFPALTRRMAGFQLLRVQQGLDPSDWKPLATVGPGVREIRVQAGTTHRVFYVARFAEAIYVLHAFEKRSRKTSRSDLDVARDRYRALVERRRKEGRHG